jgi:membrane associated rhomboid family serine protease
MPAISSPAQNSSFHQTWGGYVETILPLVAAFLVVPVEDTRELPEWLREIYSWGLVTSKFAHEHLVFSRAAWNEGKWWTILTYCFSHQDVSHLLNNLFSLTFAGMNVYNHTSTALEFYAIFFSSAGLSAYLTTRKNELQLMPMAKSFVPRNPFPSSWIRLHGWYNSQANKIAESTGHFFSQFVQYRGASAGIFGMVGALAMIEVEEAWMWMRDVWSCIRNSGSVATSTRKRLALRCFALCKHGSVEASSVERVQPFWGGGVNELLHAKVR